MMGRSVAKEAQHVQQKLDEAMLDLEESLARCDASIANAIILTVTNNGTIFISIPIPIPICVYTLPSTVNRQPSTVNSKP